MTHYHVLLGYTRWGILKINHKRFLINKILGKPALPCRTQQSETVEVILAHGKCDTKYTGLMYIMNAFETGGILNSDLPQFNTDDIITGDLYEYFMVNPENKHLWTFNIWPTTTH